MRLAAVTFALQPRNKMQDGLAANDDAVPQPPPADASILEAFNQATSPSFAERLFPYTMDNGIPQVLVQNTAQ